MWSLLKSLSRSSSIQVNNIESILSDQYKLMQPTKSTKAFNFSKIKDKILPERTLMLLAVCMEERLSIKISKKEFSSIKTIKDLQDLILVKLKNNP